MFPAKCCRSSRGLLSLMSAHYQNLPTPRRTLFDFLKLWPKPKPKVDPQDLPFSVVMPETVSPRRPLPDFILRTEYAETGIPGMPGSFPILADNFDVERMREAGKLARKVLDLAGKEVKVGVTTDEIDAVVHQACIDHTAYPSPLNYKHFPKSVCTSVNNIMVHGIPDSRPLQNGDIINIDVTVCLNEYHGDVSETYLVGEVDETGRRLVEIARKCRDEAIKKCYNGQKIFAIGNTVSAIAEEAGFTVARGYVGHGIGKLFHCKPDIWHYANHYPEDMLEGMIFTVEPVILEYPDRPIEAEDGWTIFSENYARSAQFEHTILITETGAEILTAGSEEPLSYHAHDQKAPDSDIKGESQDWTFKT